MHTIMTRVRFLPPMDRALGARWRRMAPDLSTCVRVALLLCLVTPWASAGQELPSVLYPTQPRSVGLMITLGTRDAELLRLARTHPPDNNAGLGPFRESSAAASARILSGIRQTLLPVASAARAEDCARLDIGSFRHQLDDATVRYHFRQLDDTRASLDTAKRTSECGLSLLTEEEIGAYFFLRGALELEEGRLDPSAQSFATAAGLGLPKSPDRDAPPWYHDFPIKVQRHFNCAIRVQSARRPQDIAVPDLAGMELYVNGTLERGSSLKLVPGEYVLQLKRRGMLFQQAPMGTLGTELGDELLRPDARVAATYWWTVTQATGTFPSFLEPPPEAQLHVELERLAREMLAREKQTPSASTFKHLKAEPDASPPKGSTGADAPLLQALQDYVDRSAYSCLVLVFPENGLKGQPGVALWILAGGGHRAIQLTRDFLQTDRLRVGGLALVTGLAGAGLVFTLTPLILGLLLEDPTGSGALVPSGKLYFAGDVVFAAALGLGLWQTARASQQTELPRFLYPASFPEESSVQQSAPPAELQVCGLGLCGRW